MNRWLGRAVLSFLVLPGTVAFLVPWLLLEPAAPGLVFPLGLIPLALGLVLLLWCARDFYVDGKGTLAPWDPPQELVVTGLYRFSRNPMYVAVVLVLWGWALGFRSQSLAIYALAVMVAFHLRVVFGEEPWLARTHGEAWVRYKAQVPRWVLALFLLPLAGQDAPVRDVPRTVDPSISGRNVLCSGAPYTGGVSRANDARRSISELFGTITEIDVHQFGASFVDFRAVQMYVQAQLAQRPRTIFRYSAWAEATPLAGSGVVGTIRFATGSTGRLEATGVHLCIEDASGICWWIRLAPSDVWPRQ